MLAGSYTLRLLRTIERTANHAVWNREGQTTVVASAALRNCVIKESNPDNNIELVGDLPRELKQGCVLGYTPVVFTPLRINTSAPLVFARGLLSVRCG